MSYNTLADMASDSYLMRRATACAAVEGEAASGEWVAARAWQFAAQPGWGAAYAAAVAADNPAPGKDESVITDHMILAAVQHLRNTP